MDAIDREIRAQTIRDAIEAYEQASYEGQTEAKLQCWLHETTTNTVELMWTRDGVAVLTSIGNVAIPADELEIEVQKGGYIAVTGKLSNRATTFTTIAYPTAPTEGEDWIEFELVTWHGVEHLSQNLLDWYYDYCRNQDEEDITEEESKN